MAPPERKAVTGLCPSIQGLSEKEVLNLYSLGKVHLLAPGEPLFTEGETEPNLFLILEGKVLVTGRGTGKSTTAFKKGDWLAEAKFFEPFTKSASAIATCPTTALGLNTRELSALDVRTQVFILRKLNDTSLTRIHSLNQTMRQSTGKTSYLSTYIQESMAQKSHACEKAEIIAGILSSIPRLPIYVSRLVELLQREDASIREVTSLAKGDPSLVSEILKTVNSTYYNLQRKVSDLHYALIYLGFNQVYQLVVANGLRKTMPDTDAFHQIYNHSVIVATIAFEVAQLCDSAKAPTMSTIGLLHDVGKSITLLLKQQNPKWAFFIDMLPPEKIGAMLLRKWNIPEIIFETIEFQNYPDFSPPEAIPTDHKDGVATFYVAHAICEHMAGRISGMLVNPFLGDYLHHLGFSGISIQELTERYIMDHLNIKIFTLPKVAQSFIVNHQQRVAQQR